MYNASFIKVKMSVGIEGRPEVRGRGAQRQLKAESRKGCLTSI